MAKQTVAPEEALASAGARPKSAKERIRLRRALLLGLVLIPPNCLWIFMMEIIRYSGHPTAVSLFFNAIFSLVLVLLANAVLRRLLPRWSLNRAEVITVYLMIAIASAMCGHDMLEILVSMMAHASRFAAPENNWQTKLIPYLPSWLIVTDPEAVAGVYHGNTSLLAHLRPWLTPVAAWLGFIACMLFVMLCLSTILRAQWTDRERLSYPIIELPLQMTEPSGAFFRNRLLWIGFAIAGGIDLLNGLQFLWPALPAIQVRVTNINDLVNQLPFPWNQMGWINVSFYPFIIGMGMLLPTDLLFSCWFFFWFWRMETVGAAALGWYHGADSPYILEQSVGGYLAICLAALFTARHHLAAVFRTAFGRGPVKPSGEAMSYRYAVFGLIGGFAGLVTFGAAGGLPVGVGVLFFAFYFALSIAVTRMRAELGPPAHDLHGGGPDTLLSKIAGSGAFSRPALGMMTLYYWFNRAYRGHPMPHQLEGMRLADRANTNRKSVAWAMYLAAIFGSLSAFWAGLFLYYRYGLGMRKAGVADAGLIFGWEPFRRLDMWLSNPAQADYTYLIAIGVGLAFGLLLQLGKLTFSGWVFHPLGFATSSSWSMSVIWMPLFISWAIKTMLLRYGGLRLYRQALPLFFGLILGEFVVGSLWTLLGIFLGIPTYGFWV